jgi:hypothetical protein
MLRARGVLLARPKGPLGSNPFGPSWSRIYPISEYDMASGVRAGPNYGFGNAATNFMRIGWRTTEVPRDLGELPRDYVLKVLVVNQPITPKRLFEVIKDRDDAPVDSLTHLELVLQAAQQHSWVYKEKNQTDGEFYFYIHKSKVSDVQDMLRLDREAVQRAERAEEAAKEAEKQKLLADLAEAKRNRIQQLQNLLLANYCKIKEHDPQAASQLPFATPTGALNYTWYKNEEKQ